MATCYDMMRYGVGTMLRQILKLKRNSVRPSFGVCLGRKRTGAGPERLELFPNGRHQSYSLSVVE